VRRSLIYRAMPSKQRAPRRAPISGPGSVSTTCVPWVISNEFVAVPFAEGKLLVQTIVMQTFELRPTNQETFAGYVNHQNAMNP